MLETEIYTHFIAEGDLWLAWKLLKELKMLSPFYFGTSETK